MDESSARRSTILLPSADGVQPEHVCQWWYWSGQLRSEAGRRYGFQVAIFTAEAVRGVLWGQMAHWAIVDLDAGRFTNGSRIWLGAPQRIEGRFALASPGGEVSAVGGGGRDRLRLRTDGLDLDLRASGGPVVMHYQGSAREYAFGGYSYYYSRPRMTAEAILRREHASEGPSESLFGPRPRPEPGPSRAEALRGEVWFDRQYGDLSCALAEGWQWLSMHLESGEQLMVFGFNREVGERFASITDAAGVTRWLGPDDVRLEPIEHWRSPRSGIEYPCAWRLHTDEHELEIRASLREQEMNGARWWGPVYWEGACEVSGSARGLAYVELLGSLTDWLARPMRGELASPRSGRVRALGRGEAQTWPHLQAALRHPTVTLGLATAVGWAARRLPGMRPSFPAAFVEPSSQPTDRRAHEEPLDWREAVGQ